MPVNISKFINLVEEM